jgi:short-subunit dehydrogenase
LPRSFRGRYLYEVDTIGKVAIVTGASAGIGQATVQRLASAGARVVLAARSAEKLQALAAGLKNCGCEALVVPTDMRVKSQVDRLAEAAFRNFGRIDILVNNAGQGLAGPVENVGIDNLLKIIELNLLGPLYAMQAVIPRMRQAGGGAIVNVSSMVSKMHIPGLSGYAATKAALNILSETARYELAGDNIKVCTVFPRITATDFGKNSLGDPQLRSRQRSAGESVPVDSADFVAGRILQAIQGEVPEQYMEP